MTLRNLAVPLLILSALAGGLKAQRATANPMTYRGKNGKQYVAIVAASGGSNAAMAWWSWRFHGRAQEKGTNDP